MAGIRVHSDDPNDKGDLFTQLLEAYFLTLGYADCVFNVAKAGREIDVQGRHVTEDRLLRAECKATKARSTGAQLNKFAGALEVERKVRRPTLVAGYFVSLSGFTGTALEQEEDADRGIVCVDGSAVARQLLAGNVLVASEVAAASAAKMSDVSELTLQGDPEILATQSGWMWIVYFGNDTARSHAVVLHGDGTVASTSVARHVSGAVDDGIKLVTRPDGAGAHLDAIKQRYLDYIARECGHLSFEGMPADEGLGSKQLQLEDIYTPLRVRPLEEDEVPGRGRSQADLDEAGSGAEDGSMHRATSISLGELLADHRRAAILGPPGAGKSTILKRLAVGYAFPSRRVLGEDELPELDVLPLFLRCRQLDNAGASSILDSIKSIATHSELADDADLFKELAHEAVLTGSALLLVDGLDEIADESSRAKFGRQLHTFVAMYPAVRVVVTSREAGFRIVSGAIAGVCAPFQVAPLNLEAVRRLAVAWSIQALGDTQQVQQSAAQLAEDIYASHQVRPLATNPLLLTTLLLVQRWIGEVPRKRTVLYDRAIDVLLMTWNVEGHEPLAPDETIPQLAFVAYRMMEEGTQTVSANRLSDFLIAARTTMPQVLGFVRVTPGEFVRRVEERSSLLTYSGHAEEAGRIVQLYEFKHLQFQEYLAAAAVAEGFAHGDAGVSAPKIVADLAADPSWQETLSMAIVLSGMRASEIVPALLRRMDEVASDRKPSGVPEDDDPDEPLSLMLSLLVSALADEAQLSPAIARDVSGAIIQHWFDSGLSHYYELEGVFASKFALTFEGTLTSHWQAATSHSGILRVGSVCASWAKATLEQHYRSGGLSSGFSYIVDNLSSDAELDRAVGAFAAMEWAYDAVQYGALRPSPSSESDASVVDPSEGQCVAHLLMELLGAQKPKLVFPASWALAWLLCLWHPKAAEAERLGALLLDAWVGVLKGPLRRYPAWAFLVLPKLDSPGPLAEAVDGAVLERLERFARRVPGDPYSRYGDVSVASLIAAHYVGAPWAREPLAEHISNHHPLMNEATARALADELGVVLNVEQPDRAPASRPRPRRRSRPRRTIRPA